MPRGGSKPKDMTGLTFGKLTVIAIGEGTGRHTYWDCLCQCGKKSTVSGDQLRSGKTTSCGCRRAEANKETRMTHGHTAEDKKSPEYESWAGMNKRCHNPNNHAYANYGGRGIEVCPEWRDSFEAFLDHVGMKPSPKHSIDRINNDGNYEPGNVRWATAKQQANNRRTNVRTV